jgi:4-hydroxybenzoate polyprenyltransferase
VWLWLKACSAPDSPTDNLRHTTTTCHTHPHSPKNTNPGRISESEVVTQFLVLLAAGVGTAVGLDVWAGHSFPTLTLLTIFGSFISYIYSAPPLKLKQSGWIGNYALGSSYIALPWWAGQVRRRDRNI